MKKIEIERDSVWFKPALKTLLTMKLIFLLVCGVGLLTSVAEKSYAQSTKLTFALKNTTIKDVLEHIENNSEFSFMYENNVVDVNAKVDVAANDETIDVILNRLLGETIEYRVIGRHIVLFPSGQNKGENLPALSLQQPAVSGTVTDESGQPLPGVTVLIKGTTQGTVTNSDGNYSLTNIPEDATLVFSFVGMKTKEIEVGSQAKIDVSMVIDAIGIEEVVAVGYGKVKKSDLTGSVAKAPVEKLQDYATTGFQQALAGQVAGVQIQQNSGEPGENANIRIRGVGSITASNEPLYVVDGFVGKANVNSLNINDIESIEILKDASSAAIYGSRGSSGVILITTKKGSSGKTKIALDVYSGVQQISRKIDVLNAKEFVEFSVEARDNAYLDSGGSLNDPMTSRPPAFRYPEEFKNPSSFGEGTDWQEEIFRNAPIQNYNLSLSGGSDKSSFFISGNYLNQKGIVENTDYKKYSFRINNDLKLNEKIKVGVNLTASKTEQNRANTKGHWAWGNVIDQSLNILPIIPVYNQDGSYGSQVTYGWGMPNIPSPVNHLNEISNKNENLNFLGVTYAEIDIIKNLTFRSSFSSDINYLNDKTYNTSRTEYDGRPAPQPPRASYSTTKYTNLLNENILTYSREFDEKHALNAVIVFSAQKAHSESSYMFATNFPNDLVETLNAGLVTNGNTLAYEWSLLSYLGRLNYSYLGKYLLTTSFRRDGSSRFGSNNKWGSFPSVAMAWRVSKEEFFFKNSIINDLKIKTSFGFTGNNSIPNYGSIGLLATKNYVFGENVANGLISSSLSNENLGWERTKQVNLGFELGLFENRLFAEFDYYNSKTTDLLLEVPIPYLSGYSSGLRNIGAVNNTGMEFSVSSKNLTKNFKWTTGLNISSNKNKVLALGPEGDIIAGSHITKVGYPIGNYYGFIFEGIYNSVEEIQRRPHLPTDGPGDPIIKDFNNDGLINANDRTIIGDSYPDLFYGISNEFSYRNFDLSVFFQGVLGQEVLRQDYSFHYLTEGKMNVSKDLLNRWRSPENPGNGKIPRADAKTDGFRRQTNTLWVQSADYLRVGNITFGYHVPQRFIDEFSLQSARIYCQANNLWTFTKFPGYNPETSYSEDPLQPGISWGGYPLARTVTVGINLSF